MEKHSRAKSSEKATAQRADRSETSRVKSKRIRALEHPLRARMMRILSDRGVMSPTEVSRALNAELSNVSYHMRRLEVLDCVEEVSSRPVRGAVEHFYRAIERPIVSAEEFETLHPNTAEDMVLHAVQRILNDFVASRRAKLVGFDKDFHLTRTPLILDAEGLEEGMELFERCRMELAEIERRGAERRSESGEPGIPVSSDLLLFKVPSKSLDT